MSGVFFFVELTSRLHTHSYQAPLASALYTCSDSGDCVLDLQVSKPVVLRYRPADAIASQSKIVEDAVPAEQTCLFGAKYAPPSADMSMTDQPRTTLAVLCRRRAVCLSHVVVVDLSGADGLC